MALLHRPTTKDFNTSMVMLAKRMLIIIIHHTYGETRYGINVNIVENSTLVIGDIFNNIVACVYSETSL